MNKNNVNDAAINFFKKYCSEEWIPLLQHHQQIMEIKKNQAFVREGDPVTGVYMLVSGKVKVISRFYGHEEHIFRLVDGVKLVGHRSLFRKVYTVSAVALTPVVVSFIPISLFTRLYKANTPLSQCLIEFLVRELHDSEEQQYMLTMDSVRQRIAFSLLKQIRTFGYDKHVSKKLGFTLAKKDIATLCNTTYESVIRTLSAFEKEGLVRGEGKSLIILNEAKLTNISANG